ncbi:ABC transporter permease, partial [Mycobacterium tuberculosis]
LSEYPRPLRHTHSDRAPAGPPSGAEHMSPDPVEHYPDLWVDVLDTEVGEAEAETEVREAQPGRGERHAAAAAAGTDVEGDGAAEARVARRALDVVPTLWRGALVVLQSILAVAFGAGLFIAFDQLWRWNSIVALVLSVMVILGLVVSVRAVRKTEDIASTLIAVAVGALITLGPLALLQSG